MYLPVHVWCHSCGAGPTFEVPNDTPPVPGSRRVSGTSCRFFPGSPDIDWDGPSRYGSWASRKEPVAGTSGQTWPGTLGQCCASHQEVLCWKKQGLFTMAHTYLRSSYIPDTQLIQILAFSKIFNTALRNNSRPQHIGKNVKVFEDLKCYLFSPYTHCIWRRSWKNTLSICGPLKPDGIPLLFCLRHNLVLNSSIGSLKRMSRRRRTSLTTPSLQNVTPFGNDLSKGVAIRREVKREWGQGIEPHD